MEMIVMTNVFIWIMRFTAIPFLIYHGFFFKKITHFLVTIARNPRVFHKIFANFYTVHKKEHPERVLPQAFSVMPCYD